MLFKSYVPWRGSNVGQTQITRDKVSRGVISTNITLYLVEENVKFPRKFEKSSQDLMIFIKSITVEKCDLILKIR